MASNDQARDKPRRTSHAARRQHAKKLVNLIGVLELPRVRIGDEIFAFVLDPAREAAGVLLDLADAETALTRAVQSRGVRLDRALVARCNRAIAQLSNELAPEARELVGDLRLFKHRAQALMQNVDKSALTVAGHIGQPAELEAALEQAEAHVRSRPERLQATVERALATAQAASFMQPRRRKPFVQLLRQHLRRELLEQGADYFAPLCDGETQLPFDELIGQLCELFVGQAPQAATLAAIKVAGARELPAAMRACVRSAPLPVPVLAEWRWPLQVLAWLCGDAAAVGAWLLACVRQCSPGRSGADGVAVCVEAAALTMRKHPEQARPGHLFSHLAASGSRLLRDRCRALAPGTQPTVAALLPCFETPAVAILWPLVDLPLDVDAGAFCHPGMWKIIAEALVVQRVAPVMRWLQRSGAATHILTRTYSYLFRRLCQKASDDALRLLAQYCDQLSQREDPGVALRACFELLCWRSDSERDLAPMFWLVRRIVDDALDVHNDVRMRDRIRYRAPLLELIPAFSSDPTLRQRAAELLLARCRRLENSGQAVRHPQTPFERTTVAALCHGDLERLKAFVERTYLDWNAAESALRGWRVAAGSEALRTLLYDYARDPQRLPIVLRALQTVAIVDKLLPGRKLERAFAPIEQAGAEVSKQAQRIAGSRERWLREAEHLRRTGKSPERLLHIEKLLQNADSVISQQLQRAQRHEHLHARWRAFEAICQDVLVSHWQTVLGELPPHYKHPDWENALNLLLTVKVNKRLLRQMLHERVRGVHAVLREHPKNQAFLHAARRRDAWLQPRQLKTPAGTAFIELDPLRVLQMGNLFSTCLSVGDANAFSTIANAVEVNKRVLMMTEKADRVMGRKLLVLSDTNVVYGFRSYGAMLAWQDARGGSPWVKIAFDLLAAQMALATGARFPDSQEIERINATGERELVLFAQWFNDGAEPFDYWVMPAAAHGIRAAVDAVERGVASGADMDATCRALLWLPDDVRAPILKRIDVAAFERYRRAQ